MSVEGSEHYCLGALEDAAELPGCILLAGFDQLLLAYEKRGSVFLPDEYLRGIFNLAGIVMPAILLDGTVCGKWKRTGSRLELTLFRELTTRERSAIADEAERLWSGELKRLEFK